MAKQNFIESAAIDLIRKEKASYEAGVAFITEKVAFDMRNLIRTCRKNYWGIFDKPTDPNTGQKKIWVPLTETLVESTIKNYDLDQKDLQFSAKKPTAMGTSKLVRALVKYNLDKIAFGEWLDKAERTMAIDGTFVWKTLPKKKEGEYDVCFEIKPVDLLNIYIDPTAESIAWAIKNSSFIERAVYTIDQLKSMKSAGWLNTELVEGRKGIPNTDGDMMNREGSSSEVKQTEVFERWGKMPKFIITGNEKDKEWVDGRIVVSGAAGNWVFHYAEETKGKSPYEECWYTRVDNRWYGRGVAEKVLMLQLWINTVVNIRINRARVTQLGIFKIKRGAGITPQMVGRLSTTGAITVNNMDDIDQLVMQEASQASYKDEENAVEWAQRLTSAFEVATGETLPSSTTATATAVQSRSAQSQFTMIRKGLGMFLQRWSRNQMLPILQKDVKVNDVIRIVGELDEVMDIDEQVVNKDILAQIREANAQSEMLMAEGQAPMMIDPYQVENERQSAMEKLRKIGKERFFENDQGITLSDYEVETYVTNETFDKGVLTQNLLAMLQVVPEYKNQIVDHVLDIMGMPPFKKEQSLTQQMPGMPAPQMGDVQMAGVGEPQM